jgi:hypothetical protein
VPGPVTLTRAWYHCAGCGHRLAPRDAGLGAAGVSMPPGLAAMTDLAAADRPFAKASAMLQAMAGVHLTATRVERSAEAMRYHWFRSRGLFTGSAGAESGCKAVIGQRLKLPGMHWTASRAGAIAAPRRDQASCTDDRIWQQRHNQTSTA